MGKKFIVEIKDNQNGRWKGKIHFIDKNKKSVKFNSTLELINFIKKKENIKKDNSDKETLE